MATPSEGIQLLLDAEKEASQILEDARIRKRIHSLVLTYYFNYYNYFNYFNYFRQNKTSEESKN